MFTLCSKPKQGGWSMIGYVTLGTKDLARGAKFYDAIAKEMGIGRMMEDPGG